MTDEVPPPAAAPRRRAGRGSGTVRVAPSTAKYRKLKHRFPPTPVVSEDELEAIHDASLTILEEMGMDFMHPGARAILKKAGADVREGSRARAVRPQPDPAGHQDLPVRVHAARAQPRAQCADRRQEPGVCPGGQPAQLLGPAGRAARRQPGRLPQHGAAGAALRHRALPAAATRSSRSTSMPRYATSIACPTSPS